MASIHVAVIARPGAAPDACLAALTGAGVPDARVLVHSVEPNRGAASARNAALAGTTAEVLAFVDADVAVGPGWLAALREAFGQPAGARVACVGGPLRAAFPDGRPRWLTEALIAGLGVGDRDGARSTVDPARETFRGGNLAFRVAALKGVGGFWPAVGHPDGDDWFAEEHHAQRELGRAGWTALWHPGFAAERLVPGDVSRRRVLRRHLRYGARARVLSGDREPAVALASAVKAAVGSLVPVLRGDAAGGLAAERWARVAENLGVLLGARLVAHDFAPAEAKTPFRHTVPPGPEGATTRERIATGGGRTLRRRSTVATGRILLYHRIAAAHDDRVGLSVTPEHFAEHLAVLADRDVVTLEDIAAGAPGVAITFDDGYVDNLRHGAPALAAAGLPATLFVATAHTTSGAPFWWDTVRRALREAPAEAGPLALADRAWPAATPEQRTEALRHAAPWLQGRPPDEIAAAIAELVRWADIDVAAPDDDRPLRLDELQALAATSPFTLGAHTRTHRSLGQATRADQREELARSGDDLAAWTGKAPRSVAYPYGVPGVDATTETYALAEALGYVCGVVNAPGPVLAHTQRFALPRYTVPDVPGPAFAMWLSRQV